MSRIAASYEIPFIDRVTMPRKATWMCDRLGEPCDGLKAEIAAGGPIHWDYAKHGRLGWMQFFYDWRFADLLGDGTIGFVLVCGTFRQMAYHQDGRILWKYENPQGSLFDIRFDTNCPVYDIDGDGVAELIVPRKIDGELRLCIVNAGTGAIKNSVPYPQARCLPEDPQFGHLRGSITIINASGNLTPSDILVYWDYRCITLLDKNLRHIWTRKLEEMPRREHRVFGHTPHAADINGDGFDEILASSVLFDRHGSIIWVAPDLPALVTDHHADSVEIADLADGSPLPRMVMSTGAYTFDAHGNLLFGYDKLKHGQAKRIGKITNDIPGKQIVIYEGASRVDSTLPDKVVAIDNKGNLLWEREVVQPDMQEGGFGFWLGDWNGDGLDEIFVNDPQKVLVLNGRGEIIDTIPDHLVYVFDLWGDSRAEAITLDKIEPGMRLNIVTNDKPNLNPATNSMLRRRITTPAMYNSTRY